MKYLNRKCPICNTEPPSKLEIASPKRAENKEYNKLVPYWNGFFKDKTIFSYVRCPKCELIYSPIYFTQEQIERLYAQMPPNMELVPASALEKTQSGYFKSLEEMSKLKGSYLEIGPDVGIFTKFCVEKGSFNEYWLFEPNQQVYPQLESIFLGKEKHIINDMFNFDQVNEGSISVIVMIQVLDHLIDPIDTLQKLKSKLTEDGVVLIVTHDESSILRRLFGWTWPAFCLQHPQVFNPKTINTLLQKSGFDVVKTSKTLNYFPTDFLVKHAMWAIGVRIVKLKWLSGVTVGLKLGNIMTIAKRSEGNYD